MVADALEPTSTVPRSFARLRLQWTGFPALLLVLVLGSVLGTAAHAREGGPEARSRVEAPPPLVAISAIGAVDPQLLRLSCRALLDRLPVRCEVRKAPEPDLRGAWNPARGQLDARAVLDRLFRVRAENAVVDLRITATDIYELDKAYVFGLASLTDRVALVSVARIHDADPAKVERRLAKLVLHEVGHTMNLPHHDAAGCVMRRDPTPTSLDSAPDRPCASCHALLARGAELLARPGQIALDATRGHLVRGETQLARFRFVRGLWEHEVEPAVLNEVAEAFIQADALNDAIGVLRLVLHRDPDLVEAHVNLGLALQLRDQEGDSVAALHHFETALALEPRWTALGRHVKAMKATTLRAQGPARRR